MKRHGFSRQRMQWRPTRFQQSDVHGFTQRIRTRLALGQHLPNLPTRMVEPPGDLPNAHPIPVSDPDTTVLFHRQHPSVSVPEEPSSRMSRR